MNIQTFNLPINWYEFLAKKEYSREELDYALSLSRSWETCACGQLCNTNGKRPQDQILANFGEMFDVYVSYMYAYAFNSGLSDKKNLIRYKNLAISTLIEIEERYSQLIAEINSQKVSNV